MPAATIQVIRLVVPRVSPEIYQTQTSSAVNIGASSFVDRGKIQAMLPSSEAGSLPTHLDFAGR